MCLNSCVGGKLDTALISSGSGHRSTCTGLRVIQQFPLGFKDDGIWKIRMGWGWWSVFSKRSWEPRGEGLMETGALPRRQNRVHRVGQVQDGHL